MQAREALLIKKTADGSEGAFEQLITPYLPILYNFIRFRCSESVAEDVLQESVLAIWRSIASFDGASSFKTWMLAVVSHKIADLHRNAHSHRTESVEENAEYGFEPTAEDNLADISERIDLHRAVAKLTPDDRRLIWLIFSAGIKQKEVAKLLGIPEGTVKSRLHSIKKKLKYLLEGEG